VLVVLHGLPATLAGNTGARFAARTAFGSDATMAATLRTYAPTRSLLNASRVRLNYPEVAGACLGTKVSSSNAPNGR